MPTHNQPAAGDRKLEGRGYVLVTAAYNEERHIADTLRSVTSQTLLPRRWIVVSDGSTDKTDEIIRTWTSRYPFIDFVRVEKTERHNFAAKVHALRRGFARLESVDHDFVGVLDADVSFEPDYFVRLLGHFAREPRLGVAGGCIEQHVDGKILLHRKDPNTVAGAVQFLRRECFDQTGGLPALQWGGEDAAMEMAARMHGWKTRTIPELKVVHFGPVGAAAGGPLKARFKWGRMNFDLGYHPLFELARLAYRVGERPYLLGSVAELLGFTVGKARDRRPSVDDNLVRYLRQEQLTKLRDLLNPLRSK